MAGIRKNAPPGTGAKRVALASLLLGFAALCVLGGPGSARGEPATNDDIPPGAVAFFSGGVCPEGWAPADDVEGRAVVGVTAAPNVGVSVGKPLADKEDRVHEHPFSANVTLSGRGSLVFDGDNRDGAAAKTYKVAGVTSAQRSGLAFIQVQACSKL